ncbi:MAG: hypothetical protein IT236_14120 [Bacteroidia bacterium]|nr:hypothetical protein [Bacteroidia bacterium]
MKTKLSNKTIYIGLFALLIFKQANAQDKRNYVSRSDSSLKIVEKYNNPMRAAYNIAGNVGVDVSRFNGGIFAEVVGIYSPKRFSFGASYAFDISNSNFISTTSAIPGASINKYGNTQFNAVFNFKDKIIDTKVEPTIAIDIIGQSTSGNVRTTTFYAYKTDEVIKVRKTRGIGGSVSNMSSNVYYNKLKADTTAEFITFQNNAKVPNQFLLPFSSTIIGFRYQTSTLSSYNISYTYKNFGTHKVKSTTYKYVAFEALFAPSIRNSANAFYQDSAKVAKQLPVENVKKNRFGFRVLITSNVYNESKNKVRRKPGFFYNAEFGVRPGITPASNLVSNKKNPTALDKAAVKAMALPWYLKLGFGISF